MERSILIHDACIFAKDTFLADIWPMAMYYDLWIHNKIANIQYFLSVIDVCSSLRFDPVS